MWKGWNITRKDKLRKKDAVIIIKLGMKDYWIKCSINGESIKIISWLLKTIGTEYS